MATELVANTIARAGWQLELAWRPWANGYKATQAGEFVATFPYIRTAERESIFLYSEPQFELHTQVFALPARSLDGTRPETLKGTQYCIPLGWALVAMFAKLEQAKEITLVRPNDMSSCMKLIALKKVDFTVTDSVQGEMAARLLPEGLERPVAMGGIINRESLHLLIPKNAPNAQAIMARFNQALRQK